MDDNSREESAICLSLGQHGEWQGTQRRTERGGTNEERLRWKEGEERERELRGERRGIRNPGEKGEKKAGGEI